MLRPWVAVNPLFSCSCPLNSKHQCLRWWVCVNNTANRDIGIVRIDLCLCQAEYSDLNFLLIPYPLLSSRASLINMQQRFHFVSLPFPFFPFRFPFVFLLYHFRFPFVLLSFNFRFPFRFPFVSLSFPFCFLSVSISFPFHFPIVSLSFPFRFPFFSLFYFRFPFVSLSFPLCF